MEYMKREGGDQSQTATFFREIEKTFSSVLVFMMPPPNQEVRTKSIKVTYMRDIDELFRDSLRIFAQELFKQVMQPGMVSGKVFRVCDLKLQLTDIEKQLESGEKLTITTLANSMKAKIIQEEANDCSKKYQLELKKIWGEFQVKATRIQRHTELKNETLKMFRTSMSDHYLEKQLETAVVTTLEELLDDTFKAYNDGCSKNQKWIIGGVIIGVEAFALIVYYYPAARPIILTATLACLAGCVIMKGWDIVKRYCDPNSSKTGINELVNMYTSPIKGLQAS
uniref:Atlastin-1-like n=1 Tax=Phallusia mammillata TaxID=59560 RepID=A0A6F9D6D0_9ASCI|nr:atlastin-1-like [Phallusia mammillata]